MDEIICEVPWIDTDYGWRKVYHWVYSDGTYGTSDEDGDHEPYDEEDKLPTREEQKKAWAEYAKDVASTGEDPLYEYMVSHVYTRKVHYVLQFRDSIGSAFLCRWKKGHRGVLGGLWMNMDRLAAEYFCLTKDWGTDSPLTRRPLKDIDEETGKKTYFTCKELEKFAKTDPIVRKITKTGPKKLPFYSFHMTLEETVARAPEAIVRDLKQKAREGVSDE